jgi:hypothetical protein
MAIAVTTADREAVERDLARLAHQLVKDAGGDLGLVIAGLWARVEALEQRLEQLDRRKQ